MLNQVCVLANIHAFQEYPIPGLPLFSASRCYCVLNLFFMFLVGKGFIICSSVLHKHWKINFL